MTISEEQTQRYLQLRRERGMSQAEARAVVGIGRTKSWELDRKLGLRRPVLRKTASASRSPEDTSKSNLRQRLERDEAAGVVPTGVAESLGHVSTNGAELPVALPGGETVPRRGSLLFFQGERGTQPVREFGESVHPDDAFPVPTSGLPGTPVRIRVRVRDPIPYGDDAMTRIGSHP